MPTGPNQQAREQFLLEAQELVEALSRDLLLLDQATRQGLPSAEPLSEMFRSVHTLKGLSGMFGFGAVSRLAHTLEDLLEHLRMGRTEPTAQTIDVLFRGVERFQHLLGMGVTSPVEIIEPDEFDVLVRTHTTSPGSRDVLLDYALDEQALAALTTAEENYLRVCLARGDSVYRFQVEMGFAQSEQRLAQLRQALKGIAEVVSCSPTDTSAAGSPAAIELELLIVTRASEAALHAALDPFLGRLFLVRKRVGASLMPLSAQSHSVASPARVSPQFSPTAPSGVVRVELRKLDHLMDAVSEFGTVQSVLTSLIEQLRVAKGNPELVLRAQHAERRFARHFGHLQSAVHAARMVPLSHLFEKLERLVQKLARQRQKDVQFLASGADTEIDKVVAEELADPLLHLIRNAVDHGVESGDERAQKGKVAPGTVRAQAQLRGAQLTIEVSDDGRGLDSAMIRRAAVERGLLPALHSRVELPLDPSELIFVPGFSTSDEVSELSGRGMGLDVVRTRVRRLGGTVEVRSRLDQGTTFVLTLPLRLTMVSALLFWLCDRKFAIPLSSVQEIIRVDKAAVSAIGQCETMIVRGDPIPLTRLGPLLQLQGGHSESEQRYAIVLAVGPSRLGLVIDRVYGHQDVLLKPLGPNLRGARFVMGAIDLGDPQPVLMLDPALLAQEARVEDRS